MADTAIHSEADERQMLDAIGKWIEKKVAPGLVGARIRVEADGADAGHHAPRDGRTVTGVPTITWSNSSAMSWFSMRIQPDDMALPIDCGSLVPWMR